MAGGLTGAASPAQGIKEDYDKQDDREKERYEKKLMRYLEDLIREMDRKIAKSKDRAEKESAPKMIRADDQAKLDELNQRAKGGAQHAEHACMPPFLPPACMPPPVSAYPCPCHAAEAHGHRTAGLTLVCHACSSCPSSHAGPRAPPHTPACPCRAARPACRTQTCWSGRSGRLPRLPVHAAPRAPTHAHALPRAEALVKSQALGEEGDVDAALMLSQQADAYKKQHEELFKRASMPDRSMSVCDICGVFINSTDNDERRWVRAAPHCPPLVCLHASL